MGSRVQTGQGQIVPGYCKPNAFDECFTEILERNVVPVSGQPVLNFLWRENTQFFRQCWSGMFYVTGRNEIRDPIIFIQLDKICGHYNHHAWTTYDVLNQYYKHIIDIASSKAHYKHKLRSRNSNYLRDNSSLGVSLVQL